MLTQCNLSFDHDEGTEGESDSEVIMPGHEISQTEPALVESDDVVVPFDNVSTQQRIRGRGRAHNTRTRGRATTRGGRTNSTDPLMLMTR